MKAIFYKSFLDDLARENNIEFKHYSLGIGAYTGHLEAGTKSQLFDLSSIWEPSDKILKLSILSEKNGDELTSIEAFGNCNIIYVYYAIFDQESNNENIAFVLINNNFSEFILDSQRNFINVNFSNIPNIEIKSKIITNFKELDSEVNFLEGVGVEVGENIFRDDLKGDLTVAKDSYQKYILSNLTNSKTYGPDSSTGLDIAGKNIDTAKFRKVYKENTFTLGVFDETYFINISDEIKTKYNLPREISYESSLIGGESDKGVYRTLKLTGSIEYDLYYMGEFGPEYVGTKSEEITGIDGVKIINVECSMNELNTEETFVYEIDNLLYNIRYFTPNDVDIDDPIVNPYGIFVLELSYEDLDGTVKTIRSNKLRLIQGGYYGYFSVINSDSTYTYPKDDAAMYLFGRRKGERKNFTVRIKSSIFTEYWESEDLSKIKSNINFEFENEYMEAELKKLFNFSYTINKLEDLEDVYDINVEILSLKNNDDPDHWLPYCDPDGDGVDESTLSLIKLNIDLDSTVNMYYERFYCAQGCQANSIVLVDLNISELKRAQINTLTGLVYRNDETTKSISITEEYDNQEDIELGNIPFYWKVITIPEELTITEEGSSAPVLKGEGEYMTDVESYYKNPNESSILTHNFNLKFDYDKFLGVYTLPDTLTILKQTPEEYQDDVDIEDTWETYLTHNVLKVPVKKEGVRPYVDIEGATLNEKGSELVLNLNTNPIRVEKIRINYNATMTASISYDGKEDGDISKYCFWDGENEVSSLVIENLSNEEESIDLFVVIKEVGNWKKGYKGAKIDFTYNQVGSVDNKSFKINSPSNITTYIKLTESTLEKNTYSIEYTDFIFNQTPGPGIGVGFVKKELSGYISEAGNKVLPNYESINYLSDVPAPAKAIISDIFSPSKEKIGEEYQVEGRFKTSVSFKITTKQNITDYLLDSGVVFGINEETGEYEYKYHYIKYNNNSNRELTYPADVYDVIATIELYNYNNNTFAASSLRFWEQRLSNEVVISSNSDLAGLSYYRAVGRQISDAALVYGTNNINEAIVYLPGDLYGDSEHEGYPTTHEVAYIGYHTEDENSNKGVVPAVYHELVEKYAGETEDLYIVNDANEEFDEGEEGVLLNKVKLCLITGGDTIYNFDYYDFLNSLLKVTGPIDTWENGSIIIKQPERAITYYLAGYKFILPNNQSTEFKLSTGENSVELIPFHKMLVGQDTYYVNWYNETGFTAGDYVITGGYGIPGDSFYTYEVGNDVIQIRNTQKYDENIELRSEDLIKVTDECWIKQEGGDWKVYTKCDETVDGRGPDTQFVHDITNECTNIVINTVGIPNEYSANWRNISITHPSFPTTDTHHPNTAFGPQILHLDSKEFTVSLYDGSEYHFTAASFNLGGKVNIGPLWKSVFKLNEYSDPIMAYCGIGNSYSTYKYWVEKTTGLAFPKVSESGAYYKVDGSGGSASYTNLNPLFDSYYVKNKYTNHSITIVGDPNSGEERGGLNVEKYITTNALSINGTKISISNDDFISGAMVKIVEYGGVDHGFTIDSSCYYVNNDVRNTSSSYTTMISDISLTSGYSSGNHTVGPGFTPSQITYNAWYVWGPTLNIGIENAYTKKVSSTHGHVTFYRTTTNNTTFVFSGNVVVATIPYISISQILDNTSGGGDKSAFTIFSGTTFEAGDFRLILAVRKVTDSNSNPTMEIAYLPIKSSRYRRLGYIPKTEWSKLYQQARENDVIYDKTSEDLFYSLSDGEDEILLGGKTIDEINTALYTQGSTTISYTVGNYYYPYLDSDGIVRSVVSTSIVDELDVPNSNIHLDYVLTNGYISTCRFYVEDYYMNTGVDIWDCVTAFTDNDGPYGLYRIDTLNNTAFFKAVKATKIYFDFYELSQPEESSTTYYLADEVGSNYGDPVYGSDTYKERPEYTYNDYLDKGVKCSMYFNWIAPVLFSGTRNDPASILIDSPISEITDGQENIENVIDISSTGGNHSQINRLISGYKYVIYNSISSSDPYKTYYALGPHKFSNLNNVTVFDDKECTTISSSLPTITDIDRTTVHAINYFTGNKVVGGLSSNYLVNGMGFPRRTGIGSKYIIDKSHSTGSYSDQFYLYQVFAGGESSTKVAIKLDSQVTIVVPQGSEVVLSSFQNSLVFYKIANTRKYYICTSGDNGNDLLPRLSGDTLEEKFYNLVKLYKDGGELPGDFPQEAPFIGLSFEYDSEDLPDRPKTNLMYPVSEGFAENPQPVYHVDRSELNREKARYTDYVVIEEPVPGLETDLYTADYNSANSSWDWPEGSGYVKFWNKKIKKTGKKVEFGNVSSLPSRELRLFKYKYRTDSEQRVFLPVPEGLNSNDIYKDNFIGNQEKDLTVTVRNPDFKVTVPNYTFPSEKETIEKNLNITRGYLVDKRDFRLSSFPGSIVELCYLNGAPDEAFWSSYLGHESRSLRITLQDRYRASNVNSPISDISGINPNSISVEVKGGTSNVTSLKELIDGTTEAPKYTITQNGINYAIFLNGEYWVGKDNIKGGVENSIVLGDKDEEYNFTAYVYSTLGESDERIHPDWLIIQEADDISNIIKEIVRVSGNDWKLLLNRNKTRSNRSCKLKFTNSKDSNTTALTVDIIQKAVVDDLQLSYTPIKGLNEPDENLLKSSNTLVFRSDGTLVNSTGDGDSNNGILYVRTNILNDIVDNTLYTLKERKDKIYERLNITYNHQPVFYEVSVIDSSRGNLYYTGDDYDEVYRTYKLVNLSTLPDFSKYNRGQNYTDPRIEFKCKFNEDTFVTKLFNVKHGYFMLEFTPCSLTISGGSQFFTKTNLTIDSGNEHYDVDNPDDPSHSFSYSAGSIYWNDNVVEKRPSNYTQSKYKNERNPDIHYDKHEHGVNQSNETVYEIDPYRILPHNNELDVGDDPYKIPLNYLHVSKFEWNSDNSTFVSESLDKLRITPTVEIKAKRGDEEYIDDKGFQSTLQGVLTDVFFGDMPDSLSVGTSVYYPYPEDKGYIKLLRYTRVSSRNYIVRLQLALEYKDRSLRYPLKCNLFVYYEL